MCLRRRPARQCIEMSVAKGVRPHKDITAPHHGWLEMVRRMSLCADTWVEETSGRRCSDLGSSHHVWCGRSILAEERGGDGAYLVANKRVVRGKGWSTGKGGWREQAARVLLCGKRMKENLLPYLVVCTNQFIPRSLTCWENANNILSLSHNIICYHNEYTHIFVVITYYIMRQGSIFKGYAELINAVHKK